MPDDGQTGREPTVVMSDELWRGRFGSDPAIVGKPVTLNAERRTVVGVMPAGFDFPGKAAAWTPYVIKLNTGNSMMITVLGRLKPGLTVEQATAAFETVIGTLPDGPSREERTKWNVALLPLGFLVGDIRRPLQIFAGAVLLVLLIACANVANLLLARVRTGTRDRRARRAWSGTAPARAATVDRERTALLIGAALGTLLARWAALLLLALAPAGRIPRTEMIGIDVSVIAFAIVVAAATGIVFGLAPALRLTRRRFAGSLLPGGRSVLRGQEGFRAALVVGQIALALVLLIGAGLMARSFLRLRAVDPGFRTDNVVRLSVELPESSYSGPQRLHAFHQDVLRGYRNCRMSSPPAA
jgi:predicted permease